MGEFRRKKSPVRFNLGTLWFFYLFIIVLLFFVLRCMCLIQNADGQTQMDLQHRGGPVVNMHDTPSGCNLPTFVIYHSTSLLVRRQVTLCLYKC